MWYRDMFEMYGEAEAHRILATDVADEHGPGILWRVDPDEDDDYWEESDGPGS